MTEILVSSKTATQLKIVLADTYTLLLKTQNYHWNVMGSNFFAYHQLFEQQYNELFLAVDELAERIRALGHLAPGSFKEFASMATISEAKARQDAQAMLQDLCESNEQMIESLIKLRDAAGMENDSETEDVAIARIKAQQKAAWMLRVSA